MLDLIPPLTKHRLRARGFAARQANRQQGNIGKRCDYLRLELPQQESSYNE